MKLTNKKPRIIFILLAGVTLFAASCKKDNDVAAKLPLQNETAAIPFQKVDTIKGRWANPAFGPAGYGTIYYNVITGAQDTTGSIDYNLTFSKHNNGTIGKANSNDTLRYLNTTSAFGTINLAQYASATSVTTFARNNATDAANSTLTADGWWNYNSLTHEVTATSYIVLFYRAAGSSSIYAFRFTKAWGEGNALSNRGVYTLRRGKVQ